MNITEEDKTMTSTLYIARCEKNGDEFDLLVSWDAGAAMAAAELDRDHLTATERAHSTHTVSGFCVTQQNNESADACYNRLLDDGACLCDPVEFWEIGKED